LFLLCKVFLEFQSAVFPTNLIYDKEIMQEVHYPSWHHFVRKFESFDSQECNSLFRGQSNFSGPLVKKSWKPYGLQTTFQRMFPFAGYHDFSRTLDSIIGRKEKYKCLSGIDIINPKNHLPFILYLRHGGIPMPVLDVTFDPITALYFAVAGLNRPYGVQDGVDEKDSRYISIYEFDKTILTRYYGALEIEEVNYFSRGIVEKILLITDTKKIPYPNRNMIKQKGAFIFIDSSFSIDVHLLAKKIEQDLPSPIKHHKIRYNSVLVEFETVPEDNIYKYLVERGKTGFELFDDDQALKYDFICPH
jgi:hypothetical protein